MRYLKTKRKFSETDLVSFGNYLLSQVRKERFERTGTENSLSLEERLSQVWHADLENWKREATKIY